MKNRHTHKKPARKAKKGPQKRSPSPPANSVPASLSTTEVMIEGPLARLPWAVPGIVQGASNAGGKKTQRGRPTVDDARLRGQRDALEYVFETYWGDIGWQLECLRTHLGKPEDIQKAFEPIRGQYGQNTIALFLRPTATVAVPFLDDEKTISAKIEEVRRAIAIAAQALTKAGEAHDQAQDAYAAQVKKCEEVKAAVFEARPEHRQSLKEEIVRRLEIVHMLEEEERTKAEILRRAEWAMRKAESQSGPGTNSDASRGEYQQARSEREAAQRTLEEERRIVKELKDRLGAASEEAWAFANSEAQKREAERKRLEEELAAVAMKWDGIQKTLLDQKAWLSQVELARFLKSRMAEHTPRNLANAVAGLPDIGCRVSFRRCRKFPFQTEEPSLTYQTLDFVKRCWEKQDSMNASAILGMFSLEIELLPEKKRNKHTGKLAEHYFRKHLEEHWPELKHAVMEAVKSKPNSRQVPYLILALFQRNQSKPKTALANLLREAQKLPRE